MALMALMLTTWKPDPMALLMLTTWKPDPMALGSHGPKFVTKLLSNVPLNDERLVELRDFVERVHKGPHSN